MTTNCPAGSSPVDRRVGRLQKKLAQRDRRIAGLLRRVADLERAVSTLEITGKQVDFERALQRALCNLRMIPVLGLRSNDRVVEVHDKPPNK